MRVLAVDIGGTNVKILASGEKQPRRFPSGPGLTPKKMVAGVKEMALDLPQPVFAAIRRGRRMDRGSRSATRDRFTTVGS